MSKEEELAKLLADLQAEKESNDTSETSKEKSEVETEAEKCASVPNVKTEDEWLKRVMGELERLEHRAVTNSPYVSPQLQNRQDPFESSISREVSSVHLKSMFARRSTSSNVTDDVSSMGSRSVGSSDLRYQRQKEDEEHEQMMQKLQELERQFAAQSSSSPNQHHSGVPVLPTDSPSLDGSSSYGAWNQQERNMNFLDSYVHRQEGQNHEKHTNEQSLSNASSSINHLEQMQQIKHALQQAEKMKLEAQLLMSGEIIDSSPPSQASTPIKTLMTEEEILTETPSLSPPKDKHLLINNIQTPPHSTTSIPSKDLQHLHSASTPKQDWKPAKNKWKSYYSAEHECDYWYNEETGETTWDNPNKKENADYAPIEVDEDEYTPLADFSNKTSIVANEKTNTDNHKITEKAIWKVYHSDEHDCDYWYNEQTKEVTWDNPFLQKDHSVHIENEEYTPVVDFSKQTPMNKTGQTAIEKETSTLGKIKSAITTPPIPPLEEENTKVIIDNDDDDDFIVPVSDFLKKTQDVWTSHWSHDHECEYYYNTKTREVRWDHPEKDYAKIKGDEYTPISDFTGKKTVQPRPLSPLGDSDDEDEDYVPICDFTKSSKQTHNYNENINGDEDMVEVNEQLLAQRRKNRLMLKQRRKQRHKQFMSRIPTIMVFIFCASILYLQLMKDHDRDSKTEESNESNLEDNDGSEKKDSKDPPKTLNSSLWKLQHVQGNEHDFSDETAAALEEDVLSFRVKEEEIRYDYDNEPQNHEVNEFETSISDSSDEYDSKVEQEINVSPTGVKTGQTSGYKSERNTNENIGAVEIPIVSGVSGDLHTSASDASNEITNGKHSKEDNAILKSHDNSEKYPSVRIANSLKEKRSSVDDPETFFDGNEMNDQIHAIRKNEEVIEDAVDQYTEEKPNEKREESVFEAAIREEELKLEDHTDALEDLKDDEKSEMAAEEAAVVASEALFEFELEEEKRKLAETLLTSDDNELDYTLEMAQENEIIKKKELEEAIAALSTAQKVGEKGDGRTALKEVAEEENRRKHAELPALEVAAELSSAHEEEEKRKGELSFAIAKAEEEKKKHIEDQDEGTSVETLEDSEEKNIHPTDNDINIDNALAAFEAAVGEEELKLEDLADALEDLKADEKSEMAAEQAAVVASEALEVARVEEARMQKRMEEALFEFELEEEKRKLAETLLTSDDNELDDTKKALDALALAQEDEIIKKKELEDAIVALSTAQKVGEKRSEDMRIALKKVAEEENRRKHAELLALEAAAELSSAHEEEEKRKRELSLAIAKAEEEKRKRIEAETAASNMAAAIVEEEKKRLRLEEIVKEAEEEKKKRIEAEAAALNMAAAIAEEEQKRIRLEKIIKEAEEEKLMRQEVENAQNRAMIEKEILEEKLNGVRSDETTDEETRIKEAEMELLEDARKQEEAKIITEAKATSEKIKEIVEIRQLEIELERQADLKKKQEEEEEARKRLEIEQLDLRKRLEAEIRRELLFEEEQRKHKESIAAIEEKKKLAQSSAIMATQAANNARKQDKILEAVQLKVQKETEKSKEAAAIATLTAAEALDMSDFLVAFESTRVAKIRQQLELNMTKKLYEEQKKKYDTDVYAAVAKAEALKAAKEVGVVFTLEIDEDDSSFDHNLPANMEDGVSSYEVNFTDILIRNKGNPDDKLITPGYFLRTIYRIGEKNIRQNLQKLCNIPHAKKLLKECRE